MNVAKRRYGSLQAGIVASALVGWGLCGCEDASIPNGLPPSDGGTSAEAGDLGRGDASPLDADDGTFIRGRVSGAREGTFGLPGGLSCAPWDVGGDGGTAEISGLRMGAPAELLAIVLDYDQSGIGTFPLVGSGDAHEPGTALYQTRYEFEGTTYRSGNGTVTITAWPDAAGEPIAGSFEATLMSDSGGQVTIEATFDGFAHANPEHFGWCQVVAW